MIVVAIGADRARCSLNIAIVKTGSSDTVRYVTVVSGTEIWRAVAGIDRASKMANCAPSDAVSRSGQATCYRNAFNSQNLGTYKHGMEDDP